jgi:hypothetical protein
MTLHVAIEKLLNQLGRPMTTTEIAKELNRNRGYKKKDGTEIMPFQIYRRTKKYSNMFVCEGATVFLKEDMGLNDPNLNLQESEKEPIDVKRIDKSLEEQLMNEDNFKNVAEIDNLVPSISGIYCIRVRDINKLPVPFNKIIKER